MTVFREDPDDNEPMWLLTRAAKSFQPRSGNPRISHDTIAKLDELALVINITRSWLEDECLTMTKDNDIAMRIEDVLDQMTRTSQCVNITKQWAQEYAHTVNPALQNLAAFAEGFQYERMYYWISDMIKIGRGEWLGLEENEIIPNTVTKTFGSSQSYELYIDDIDESLIPLIRHACLLSDEIKNYEKELNNKIWAIEAAMEGMDREVHRIKSAIEEE